MIDAARRLACTALEAALNRLLQLDPAAAAHLADIEGDTLHLHCTSPDASLFIRAQRGRLYLSPGHEGPVTTRLSGPGRDFIALLGAADPAGVLINSELQLSGDSAPLMNLQALLASLEPDWEVPLAAIFGDVGAHAIGRGLRQGHRQMRESVSGWMRQSGDFLRYESGWTPANEELASFADEVDALALRSERLAASLAALRRRADGTGSQS